MLNPVYCRHCRETLNPTDTFCRSCGADQRQPAQAPPPEPTIVAPPAPSVVVDRASEISKAVAAGLLLVIGLGLFVFGVIGIQSSRAPIEDAKTQIMAREAAGNRMAPNEQAYVMNTAEPQSAKQFQDATAMIGAGLLLCLPYAAIRISAGRKARRRS